MSLGDPGLLAVLYDGLATPPLSPTPSTRRAHHCSPHYSSPSPSSVPTTPIDRSPKTPYPNLLDIAALPPGSLLPNKLPLRPPTSSAYMIDRDPPTQPLKCTSVIETDSLTREKKGKMPALSHLLSVGKGRVLALAADEQYVYAGCQSEKNEIVVSHPTLRVGMCHSRLTD